MTQGMQTRARSASQHQSSGQHSRHELHAQGASFPQLQNKFRDTIVLVAEHFLHTRRVLFSSSQHITLPLSRVASSIGRYDISHTSADASHTTLSACHLTQFLFEAIAVPGSAALAAQERWHEQMALAEREELQDQGRDPHLFDNITQEVTHVNSTGAITNHVMATNDCKERGHKHSHTQVHENSCQLISHCVWQGQL